MTDTLTVYCCDLHYTGPTADALELLRAHRAEHHPTPGRRKQLTLAQRAAAARANGSQAQTANRQAQRQTEDGQ